MVYSFVNPKGMSFLTRSFLSLNCSSMPVTNEKIDKIIYGSVRNSDFPARIAVLVQIKHHAAGNRLRNQDFYRK